jgi:hypothetical protein
MRFLDLGTIEYYDLVTKIRVLLYLLNLVGRGLNPSACAFHWGCGHALLIVVLG